MELSISGDRNTRKDFRLGNQDGGHELPRASQRLSDICFSDISSNTEGVESIEEWEEISGMLDHDRNQFSWVNQDLEVAKQQFMGDSEFSTARTTRDHRPVDGTSDDSIPPTIPDSDVFYDASMGFSRYSTYSPVIIIPGLECSTIRSNTFHANLLGSQLNIPAGLHELQFENDMNLKEYLLFGVQNGFLIVDEHAEIPAYEGKNYSSVLKGEAHDFIDDLIKSELRANKYVVAQKKPRCVHGLGAVPKKSGGWRPITNCKEPVGSSINSYMTTTYKEFCYSTVDNVISRIQPGCYMASVDIQAAYRSILVHPSQWEFQGVAWSLDGKSTYLYDTHVCFGLKCAPYLFTQVSNFVLRCLHRRGFSNSLVYLDDFLLICDTRQECENAQQTLISILRSLGFYIAWKKCTAPSQIITYLGVEFNSCDMSVSLPWDKMNRLHTELNFFMGKSRASKRQVQRLCGILSHCAKVVKGGRTFSQRIISLLKGWPASKKRIRLSTEFKYDLYWWKQFAEVFNGKNQMIQANHGAGPSFFTDACLSGYGCWEARDWQAGYYNVSVTPNLSTVEQSHKHWVNVHIDDHDSQSNINVLELIPVWLYLKRRASEWRDLHVLCRCDNISVQFAINNGYSSNKISMALLRDIFWVCATENIHLSALHIPGSENKLADALSRICFSNSIAVLNEFDLCCSTASHSSGYG